LTVAVVGGGIGGLTAALALLRAGLDVHVYEQAQELREVGAGIQIGPNASRILHGLGLADRLDAAAVRPAVWRQRRWDDGRTLLQAALGDAVVEAFGFPYYQIHRSDLLAALLGALPQERIHAGRRLVSITAEEDRVVAGFEDGGRVAADALVGADGIHSTVRSWLFGPEQPRFTGCVAYRGLIPAERVAELELPLEAQSWIGPGRHFVHYYVRNRRLLNFVAALGDATWTRESWTDRGDVAELRAAFEGWHPDVRAILERVGETFVWALFDRPPLERWSAGRVTLLGDACHPMLPFMAQGAAQAIEDAATLAACLAGAADVPAALRRYESLRLPRTTKIQALSAQNQERFHLPDGPAQQARDAELAERPEDWAVGAIAWIYGHDAGSI
jgi:salicylate hydroxylase